MLGHLLGLGRADVADGDVATRAGEGVRRGRTDAAGPAADERDSLNHRAGLYRLPADPHRRDHRPPRGTGQPARRGRSGGAGGLERAQLLLGGHRPPGEEAVLVEKVGAHPQQRG